MGIQRLKSRVTKLEQKVDQTTGTPEAHRSTHVPGGSDQLTFWSASTHNHDSSYSDLAHSSRHVPGGSDQLTYWSASTHAHTHASTTGQTANDHHAQLHNSTHLPGSSDQLTYWSASNHTHAQLHDRQHAINSASDHTGYGDAVTKNAGTAVGTLAEGDHLHAAYYLTSIVNHSNSHVESGTSDLSTYYAKTSHTHGASGSSQLYFMASTITSAVSIEFGNLNEEPDVAFWKLKIAAKSTANGGLPIIRLNSNTNASYTRSNILHWSGGILASRDLADTGIDLMSFNSNAHWGGEIDVVCSPVGASAPHISGTISAWTDADDDANVFIGGVFMASTIVNAISVTYATQNFAAGSELELWAVKRQ